MNAKGTYWIFRYYSGRGTDRRICVILAKGTTDKEALEYAVDWARQDTANTCCHEYSITIKRIKPPPDKETWNKRWSKLYKAFEKAQAAKNDWFITNHPHDWTTK